MFVVQFFDGLADSDSSSKDLLANLMFRRVFGPYATADEALEAAKAGVQEELDDLVEMVPSAEDTKIETYTDGAKVLGYYIEPFDDGNRYVGVVSEVMQLG